MFNWLHIQEVGHHFVYPLVTEHRLPVVVDYRAFVLDIHLEQALFALVVEHILLVFVFV